MTALVLNLVALAGAPFVHRFSGRAPALEAGLDACLRALVFGLVAGQVLPHGLHLAGWPALVAAVVGAVAFPWMVERNPSLVDETTTPASRARSTLGLGLVFAALIAHSLVDGVGLAGESGASPVLALAIVLHALPLGLIVWHGLSPRYGEPTAIAALVAAGASTAVGFLAPNLLSPTSAWSDALLGVLPALVGGSLLHAVAHPWKDGLELGSGRWSSGVGAVLGVVIAGVIVLQEPVPALLASELDLSQAIRAVVGLGAPAVGLGTVIAVAGAIAAGTPAKTLSWTPGVVVVGALLGPWVGGMALVIAVALFWAKYAAPPTYTPPAVLLRDTIDPLLPWWLLGTVVAAAMEPWLASATMLGAVPAVLAALCVAWVFPAEVVAVAPIAAVLVHKGLPVPAAAAWVGAVAAHRGGAGPTIATAVGLSCATLALAGGLGHAPALHAATPSPLTVMWVLVLLGLVGWSLLRRGLTGFLEPVLHPGATLPAPG